MSASEFPGTYEEWLQMKPAEATFHVSAILKCLMDNGFDSTVIREDSFRWRGRVFDGPFCPLLFIKKNDEEAVLLFTNRCVPPVKPFLFELYYLEEFDHRGCRFRASIDASLFASDETGVEITQNICASLGLPPLVAAVPASALGIPLPIPPWIRLYPAIP